MLRKDTKDGKKEGRRKGGKMKGDYTARNKGRKMKDGKEGGRKEGKYRD